MSCAQLASKASAWLAGRGRGTAAISSPAYSVDLHDIVLIWPLRRSPTELRVQPSPDGSDSIASSVDFDTTVVFFFCCFRKKLRARVTRNKENNNSGLIPKTIGNRKREQTIEFPAAPFFFLAEKIEKMNQGNAEAFPILCVRYIR